jgi:hypothetical protein
MYLWYVSPFFYLGLTQTSLVLAAMGVILIPRHPWDLSRRSPHLRRVPPRYGGLQGEIHRRLMTNSPHIGNSA